MDLRFISEFTGFAFCFHPKNPSVFVLTQQTEHLTILEVDLYTKAVCRTYDCPKMQLSELPLVRTSARNEKYSLSFLVFQNQIALASPFGHVAFFDYYSSMLLTVLRVRGRRNHHIGVLCIYPKLDKITLFYTADGLKPIYMVEASNIQGKIVREMKKKIQKSTNITILQLGYHPNLNYLYGACSDGCIHVWSYELDKEVAILTSPKQPPSRAPIGSCLHVDNETQKMIHGNTYGFIFIWNIANASEEHVEESSVKRSFGVQAASWLSIMRSDKYQYLVATFSNGSLAVFKYIYAEGKSKSKFEEICTLLQGEENLPIPFYVDHTNFVMSHPVLPFITSTWLKCRNTSLLKSTVFLIYQNNSQGGETAVKLSITNSV